MAVYSALAMLNEGEIGRIVITRPTVSDEEIGFLPGDISDKMDPWMAPIYENIKTIIGAQNLQFFVDEEIIQIKPLAFLRGQTFTKSCVIVDEAQNVTHKQMEMIVGRLGRGSKMVICGDMRQKDLKGSAQSGLPFLINNTDHIHKVGNIELTTNHRHDVVEELLNLYRDLA